MKFEVGQKVKIKSLDWYNKNKDGDGVVVCGGICFLPTMTKFCGKTVMLSSILADGHYNNSTKTYSTIYYTNLTGTYILHESFLEACDSDYNEKLFENICKLALDLAEQVPHPDDRDYVESMFAFDHFKQQLKILLGENK